MPTFTVEDMSCSHCAGAITRAENKGEQELLRDIL